MLMNPDTENIMKVICEEKVAVVTTGAGNPGPYIEALKASGTKILSCSGKCGTRKTFGKSRRRWNHR